MFSLASSSSVTVPLLVLYSGLTQNNLLFTTSGRATHDFTAEDGWDFVRC